MSESNHELRLLERVTTRAAASDPAAAHEDPELREGWETLVQLAGRAAAEHPFDESEFLAKVSLPVTRRASATRGRLLLVLGALAASVVAAVVVGGYVASLNWGNPNLAGGTTPGRETLEHPARVGPEDRSEVKWDDSLDEQIRDLYYSVYYLDSAASAGDRSLEALGVQLQQFGSEIENGSL